MMRNRFRKERLRKDSPPTDALVEHRDFRDRAMSIVWDAIPHLSRGQQVIIRDVFYGGKTLGHIAQKYDSSLDVVSKIYNDTITALRGYLKGFADKNEMPLPREPARLG